MTRDWVEKTIGDVCTLKSGTTVKKTLERATGDVPYVKVADMNLLENKDEITTSSRFLQNKDVGKNAIFPAGSTIFPKRGGAILTNKKRITAVPICADLNVMCVSPSSDIYSRFLYYYFLSVDMKKLGSGSSIPQINNYDIAPLQFSYPSLSEQKRIVDILDDAFAGISQAVAHAEKNLVNARELFESCLRKIFNQYDEGWEIKPLESFSNIVNGYAFKSGDFSTRNDVKSIKITNVGVYEFVQESGNYLPKNYLEEYSRYKAYEGDVVVALTRTIISSGLKVAVVPAEYDGALINQRVAAVQVDEGVMPKQVLQAFLSTKMAIDYVRSNVNELMQPNLSIKDLKAFPIPVPPADKLSSVSNQIAEIRETTDQMVALYESKLDLLNDLKQSLLQKAFSGELTADDNKLMDEIEA